MTGTYTIINKALLPRLVKLLARLVPVFPPMPGIQPVGRFAGQGAGFAIRARSCAFPAPFAELPARSGFSHAGRHSFSS